MYQRMVLLSLPRTESIDIQFADLTCEVRVGFRGPLKKILNNVSGTFKTGELSAIMGPSGAGKSTLLNILTGFQRDKWTGKIEYVGKRRKHSWKEYRKQSCYIQQNDCLLPLFTVWEMMWMAANLKIGESLSRKSKEMLIVEMLENLDLSKIKETKCGCLSGGQKKRMSIALELLDNPPVMFLDEPTTGLDSLSSYQCIKLLRGLAKSGRTIICTIHQPSAAIYEMFDTAYLLAEGRCAYEGAPTNALAYFASVGLHCPKYHNLADYIIEVVNKEYGDFNDQLVKLTSNTKKSWRLDTLDCLTNNFIDESKVGVLVYPPSEFRRFLVLTRRFAIVLFRDWTATYLKIVSHVLIGVILGLLYTNAGNDGSKSFSNVGFLLVTSVYLSYTNMMPAVFKFPAEIEILKKERFNNWYQLRTYFAASFVCNLPIQILMIFAHISVSYFLAGQPTDVNRYFMFLLVAIMTALVSESIGLFIGVLTNPTNGTFLGAIILCGMMSLCGFLALFKYMPRVLYYTSYVSYIKYSLHGFFQALYGYNREKMSCPKLYCHYNVPKTLMMEMSMIDGNYWIDILYLLCYYVLFRIAVYVSLKRKLSKA